MSDQPTLPLLRPTVPGMVRGIVDLDPFTLECGNCGSVHVSRRRPAVSVILSGYRFHPCEEESPRYCPDCLAAVKAACPNGRCKR